MMRQGRRPPRLATWLVERAVPEGRSRDGLLGDMEERFHRRAAGRPFAAAAGYWAEAAGSAGRYAAEAVRTGLDDWRGGGMEGWIQDARFAVRSARRRPAFAALVVATLALGVGANTAVFSVVHAVLLEALPYEAPERLVMADQLQTTGHRAAVSMPNYEDWRDRSTVFEAFAMEKPETYEVASDRGAEILDGRAVLGDFFTLLGREPVLGSLPTAAELAPGARPFVVITHGLWSRRFGGQPDVVGQTLGVNGVPFEVAAVLPPDFELDRSVQLYTPLGLSSNDPAWQDRGTSFGGWVVAELRPGVTLTEARADMARVTRELRAELGDDLPGPALFSMRDWYVGEVRQPVLFLMGAVALVLLVACANVASLLLGRAQERRGELSVRTALGADRTRVLRQLLTETMILGLVGIGGGLVLGHFALQALVGTVAAALPEAFVDRVGLNGTVVAIAAATAAAVMLALATVTALPATGAWARPALGRSVGSDRESSRLRGLLVAGEVAVSVVLLVCTGLLVQSVGNLRNVDTGFVAEGVLTQRIRAASARYPGREASFAVHERIREEVARLPGVEHVASSNLFPLSRTNWEMLFRERSRFPEDEPESVLYTAATVDYFDVFSIPLVRGRLFTDQDRTDTEPVVVIDETAAERYWPGEDPLGRQVAVDDVQRDGVYVPLWRTVVGIVGHVRNYELTTPSRIEAYVPLAQSPACCGTLWLTVRAGGDPASLAPAVRRVVSEIDAEMPVYRVNTMSAVVEAETVVHQAVREMFVFFGTLALALGAVGIYGVVASSAARRRREIGVRMALGSLAPQAAGRVALEGLRWAGSGLAVGLVAAVVAGRAIQTLLVDVTPLEPTVLAGAAAVLAAAALAAAWVPALRAARVDPVTVLREE